MFAENIVCTHPRCDRRSFHKSGRCPQHLSKLIWATKAKDPAIDLRLARGKFESAARKQWTFPPSYDIVRERIEDILHGKRPGSDLVVLDDEFSPASHQLWEFAMIERISGDAVINTIIEHQDGLEHYSLGENPFLAFCSRAKAKSVFLPSRNIDHMNIHKIAETLQRKGISQDTIILVYHKTRMDLKLLRQLLESEGYCDILPPDENCFPLIQLLRTNMFKGLPKDQHFPLKLEIVFPIMFPRHELIGLNHQALVDYEQARLVCKSIDELCKPVDERGEEWQPETIARSGQTSILDWLRDGGIHNTVNGELLPPFEGDYC